MSTKRRATFLASVNTDMLAIQKHVAEQSCSVATGERLVATLKEQCHRLAAFDVVMGRPHPDLGSDIRSSPFGSYIIVFRYRGGRFEVIAAVERHRDMQAHLESRKP